MRYMNIALRISGFQIPFALHTFFVYDVPIKLIVQDKGAHHDPAHI